MSVAPPLIDTPGYKPLAGARGKPRAAPRFRRPEYPARVRWVQTSFRGSREKQRQRRRGGRAEGADAAQEPGQVGADRRALCARRGGKPGVADDRLAREDRKST